LFSRLLDNPNFYYGLFVALLLPALLLNLGVHHLFVHTDESRRALVALEMIFSGDYISPTINGVAYLNKPPLYNWIVAASFKLFGNYSAFALRFPVVIATLLFGGSIIFFYKPIVGKWRAWLVAIATITSGRILFYDSFLGLIDILFSTLIFINFMLWYVLGSKGKFGLLFSLSYFLMAVAYLMKGLPPIVFQFFTLLAFAIYSRDWRFLFKPAHFLGVLWFIVPVGAYYALFFSQQTAPVSEVFQTLWSESAKRTVTDYGMWDTVLSILVFPFENIYHFAPWSFFLILLWRKSVRVDLWRDNFSRFLILVFAFNIIVYWTSPGVHPRYLFMFLPLLFGVLFQASIHALNTKLTTILQRAFGYITVLGCALPLALYFFADGSKVESFGFKMLLVSLGLMALTTLYWRRLRFSWILLGCFLLVVRIAYDWVILPERDKKGAAYTAGALQVLDLSKGKELAILGSNYCHDGTSFLISRERGQILPVLQEAIPGRYYIIVEFEFDPQRFESLYTFGTNGTDYKLHLATLKDAESRSHEISN